MGLIALTFWIKKLPVRLYNLLSIFLFTPLVLFALFSYPNELFILLIIQIDEICLILNERLYMREIVLLFIIDIA